MADERTPEEILAKARLREEVREQHRRPIDYDRMKKRWPRQKAALTRAKGNRMKVLKVCADAVNEWDEIGAWPDDWSLFQRALDDEFPVVGPRLEDLRP